MRIDFVLKDVANECIMNFNSHGLSNLVASLNDPDEKFIWLELDGRHKLINKDIIQYVEWNKDDATASSD